MTENKPPKPKSAAKPSPKPAAQPTPKPARISVFAKSKRVVRKIFGVPENFDQIVLSEKIVQRAHLLRQRAKHMRTITDKLEATLKLTDNKYWPLTEKELADVTKNLADLKSTSQTQQNLVGVLETYAKSVSIIQTKGGGQNTTGIKDLLFQTKDYPKMGALQSPYVMRNRGKIKVLLLNSVGGSMSRLSKALLSYENIDADCYVASYAARRQLFYAHETNANGVLSHSEWREFLHWAVGEYDIVQSSTLPLHAGIAECYDWLSDSLGRRHIWRTTGFIHHYMKREDVLPVSVYKTDTGTTDTPDPKKYSGRTFSFKTKHMHTDPHVVFYSSPEKGAYLKGKDNIWLPSIRDPESYRPVEKPTKRAANEPIKIYVPYHKQAVFKGMDIILKTLETIRDEGYNIEIVTPENATGFWPDLKGFRDITEDGAKASIYPIPNYLMPELLRRIDFVIDQIIMGCYGNTAIEAMMCAKPVIAQKRYADFDGCPVVEANAKTLKATIIEMITNPDRWAELGKQGRAYALRKHTPQSVGKVAADTYRRALDEAK